MHEILFVAGMLLVSFGAAMIYIPVGIIVSGICLITLGLLRAWSRRR